MCCPGCHVSTWHEPIIFQPVNPGRTRETRETKARRAVSGAWNWCLKWVVSRGDFHSHESTPKGWFVSWKIPLTRDDDWGYPYDSGNPQIKIVNGIWIVSRLVLSSRKLTPLIWLVLGGPPQRLRHRRILQDQGNQNRSSTLEICCVDHEVAMETSRRHLPHLETVRR